MALIPKENLVKASNMMFFSAGLTAIRFGVYLFQDTTSTSTANFIVSISVLLVLAFFVRAGFEWARWIFLLLLTFGVLFSPFAAFAMAVDPLGLLLYTFQLILQIYAGILMFRKRDG